MTLATELQRLSPGADTHARTTRPRGSEVLNGEGIFELGERGFHLLFDRGTIAAALDEDPMALQAVVVAHRAELEDVLLELLGISDARTARLLIAGLPNELRHVLVHLYFEILEGRMRRAGAALH